MNLGGVQFVGPLSDPTDTSLLRKASLSVTVRGDITGDITAGMLYRIDALRNGANTAGGNISGNLRAVRRDGAAINFSAELNPAIAYVRAGWQITGDIIAEPELNSGGQPIFNGSQINTYGSIGRVVVGPTLTAPGLRGDIRAEYGAINDVFSTGQIGSGPNEPDRVKILGGVRVAQVRVGLEGTSAPLDRPIYADIHGARREVESLPLTSRGASLSLIETAGDYFGSIKAYDVYGFNDSAGPTHSSGRKGIFIGGDMYGSIDVAYSYQYADMVARSFRQPITIGQMLKGSIIAVGTEGSTDPLDGTIHSVSVGYSPQLSIAPRRNKPGFNAIASVIAPPPFEGPARDNWYSLPPNDSFTVDSVIRAASSIGDIRLSAMSQRLPEFGPLSKHSKARVEAPVIGYLQIGDFESGVVWSGRLKPLGTETTNLIQDDYAEIVETVIGCMGPKADLWIKDIVTADVLGDAFGEIHMPEAQNGELVRIGGRFGDLDQALANVAPCQAEVPGTIYKYATELTSESSPRGVWNSIENDNDQGQGYGVALRSRLLVRQPAALSGQVVLHANNTTTTRFPATHWRGDVLIGTGLLTNPNLPGTPFVISADSGRASLNGVAPDYKALSSSVGLGSVGLVPLNLHDTDCLPPNGTKGICEIDPYLPNNNKRTVVLRHYGPISQPSETPVAVVIERQDWEVICPSPPPVFPNPTCYVVPVWNDVTSCFDVSVARESSVPPSDITYEREIWIWPRATVNSLCPGEIWSNRTYRIRPRLSTPGDPATTRVRSDQTLVTVDPPVIYWEYVFSLECFDLNMNGMPDMNDVPVFLTQHADYNEDEVVDTQDLSLLVQAIVNGGE